MPLNPGRRLGQVARNASSQSACAGRSTCPASNLMVCAAIDVGGGNKNYLVLEDELGSKRS